MDSFGYNSSSDMDIVSMEHRDVNTPPMTSLTELRTNALTVRTITNEKYEEEKESCCRTFDSWCTDDQIDFIEDILLRMTHFQHGHIHSFLKPMLQRDFITLLPGNTFIKQLSLYLSTKLRFGFVFLFINLLGWVYVTSFSCTSFSDKLFCKTSKQAKSFLELLISLSCIFISLYFCDKPQFNCCYKLITNTD